MRYVWLVTVFLSWCNFTITCLKDTHQKDYFDRIRCTRRYSVGTCGGPIAPVWSYVPHLQNCTQRLGCKKATVSNRFPTRKRCMRHCQRLQDLYMMLLAPINNLTQSASLSLRGGFDTLRRNEMDIKKEDELDDYTDQEEQPELPMMGAPVDFYGDLGTEPAEPYNGWGRHLD